MDADLEEAGDDRFDAIVDFGDGAIVSWAIDFSDHGISGLFAEGGKKMLGLVGHFFGLFGGVIRDDDKERLVHNVGFLRKNVDEINIVIHKDSEEHIVVGLADLGEAFEVGANVDALGADENLDGKVERIKKILVGILDALAFGRGHKVKVDGTTSDDGSERAIFHDDESVAKFGDEKSGLGGVGIVDGASGSWGLGGRKRSSGGELGLRLRLWRLGLLKLWGLGWLVRWLG